MDLFEHLTTITTSKVQLDKQDIDNMKSYNPYIINKFVSMSDIFIPLVNEINKYPNIPKDIHQRFFKSTLPKRKQYFKYLKKKKEKSDNDINYIADWYEITFKDAKMYMDILTDNQIKSIVKKYEYGNKKKINL